MKHNLKAKFCISIVFSLTVIALCGYSFVEAHASNTNGGTNGQFHHLKSAVTILSNEEKMTNIDIQATVGNLAFLYGDKPKIEVGKKLVNHASVSYDNGTLIYRDDFGEDNLSFDDMNNESIILSLRFLRTWK